MPKREYLHGPGLVEASGLRDLRKSKNIFFLLHHKCYLPDKLSNRPRFGVKKKNIFPTKVSASHDTSETANNSTETPVASLTLPGCSNGILSSSDLLDRMKMKNRLLGLPGEDSVFLSANEEESLILDTTPLEFATGVDYHSMMENIRSFVAFRGVVPGQVLTTDILGEFDGKLPARGAPLFRALLNQLCTFTRNVHNQGIWQLKPEFQ